MNKEKKYYEWGYDEKEDIKFRYVQINNPIELGIKIGIGIIIANIIIFSLIMIIFPIFGISLLSLIIG